MLEHVGDRLAQPRVCLDQTIVQQIKPRHPSIFGNPQDSSILRDAFSSEKLLEYWPKSY
jgi:hypothetical protein